MFRHVEPFWRYLRSKGRLSDSNGKVSMVELREYQFAIFSFCFLTPLFAGFVCFHFPVPVTFTTLCPPSLTPYPPHTKIWGSVPHISTYPPVPPTMPSTSKPTPSKTSSALVKSLFFALVQSLLERVWVPFSSFDLPLTFGRSPINRPTPLQCISSLNCCPCHRRKRPTGVHFFSLFFVEARKAPEKGTYLSSPTLLSHVLPSPYPHPLSYTFEREEESAYPLH